MDDGSPPACNITAHACSCAKYSKKHTKDVTHTTPVLRGRGPLSLLGTSEPACALHLSKSVYDYYRRTNRQHVSLQATVFDLHRLRALLPLRLKRHEHHIEELLEEAGMRRGNVSMLFVGKRDLGVAKYKCTGDWSVGPAAGHADADVCWSRG